MGLVVVSGAFGALGPGVVEFLAKRDHRVVALGFSERPADFVATDVIDGIDLTDDARVNSAFERIGREHGAIDRLVNIAGGFMWQPLATSVPADWERMFRTSLLTAALAFRHAVPLLAQNGASIVNVGAAAAREPGKGMAPYAASKAGVVALTHSLADEVGPAVRVNAVLPTIIDTPANRRDMPDADHWQWVPVSSLASVIAFLLSPDAAGVSGEGILVSLGTA